MSQGEEADAMVATADATARSVVERVEAARARVADAAGRPVAEQLPVYDEVHAVLQDALAALDDR